MDINTLKRLRGVQSEKSSVEPNKIEPTANKDLTRTDLAQFIRKVREIAVSPSQSQNIPPAHDEDVYSFITPDMIDENGYLKMNMEEQKALADGIYEFFKSGLEPSIPPQNPENSDQ